MDKLLSNNISEWKEYSVEKYNNDELKNININFVKYLSKLPKTISDELMIILNGLKDLRLELRG